MDFNKIKKEFGKYLVFQGGVDIQGVMPFGTVEDVKAEVKRVIETLGPGGGYILCTSHNIQPDTPSENIRALYDAAQEFGNYREGAS
jgi:uroporphyrinogen decarboxylase